MDGGLNLNVDAGEPNASGESPGEVARSPSEAVYPRPFGDYELLGEIARGGMGVVYQARQVGLDRIVALKLLLFGPLASPQLVQRFRTEAAAAASLRHPNIVAIHEVGFRDGQHFFAMEYVAGSNLAELARHGPLPARRAAAYLRTIAQAIHYAHECGVLHRDLKPSNVLIDASDQPRVTDFGLAKRIEKDTELTLSGQVLGSPNYMSPEQAGAQRGQVGKRSDVYSLGAILYQLLTGRPPFVAETIGQTLHAVLLGDPVPPRVLNPSVPRDLETICLKCLEKEPARRYESARALADDLNRLLSHEPIVARPAGAWERTAKWVRRKPAVSALVTLVILVTLAGLIGVISQWRRAENARRDATERLRSAYRAEAQARRWSGRPGQRFESLAALSNAAAITPSLELRSDAIACLSLVDARLNLDNRWPAQVGSKGCYFDDAFERYAQCEPNGDVRIRLVNKTGDLRRLPSPAGAISFRPALSGDGRLLAVAYEGGSTIVWRTDDGTQAFVLATAANCLEFSRDGRLLAVVEERPAGSKKMVPVIYDTRDGREVPTLMENVAAEFVRFSPDGGHLAVVEAQGRNVEIRSVFTSLRLGRLAHSSRVSDLAWHPQGERLAVVTLDGSMHIWDARAQRRERSYSAHRPTRSNLIFNRRGDVLASSSWDGTTVFWDALLGERLLTLPVAGSLLGFRADDRRLALNPTSQSPAELWEIEPGGELTKLPLPSQRSSPDCVEFEPGGRLLAVAGLNGIALWDLAARREIAFLPDGSKSVRFDPSGDSLLAGGTNGLVRWPLNWTNDHGHLTVGPPQPLRPGAVYRFDLSADGNTVAILTPTQLAVGRLDEAGLSFRPMGRGRMDYVAISPDGQWVATGVRQRAGIKVWNASRAQSALDLPTSDNARVVFSPDNRWLVTGSGQEYRFWSVGSWNSVLRIPQINPRNLPSRAAFSRDGKLVALPMFGAGIRLLDPASLQELATFPDYGQSQSEVHWLSFSAGAGQLAIAGTSEAVYFWDLLSVRRQLRAMKLDWGDALPSPPVPARPAAIQATVVE
jgi:WD40 repeat protein